MKPYLMILTLVFAGCAYHKTTNTSPQGRTNTEVTIAVMNRAHQRTTEQSGVPNPIPASEPYRVDNTASNATGFEDFATLYSRDNLPRNPEVQGVGVANGGSNPYYYRVTDFDTDPEPAVRTARNATVGAALTSLGKDLINAKD